MAILENMREAELLCLLCKKRGLFETILSLSEDEAVLPVGEWIAVMEQKKVLLSRVEGIDEQLEAFEGSLQAVSDEIARELERIRAIIKVVLHLDVINQGKRRQEFSEG